jgi:streptogramin lyase
MITSPISMSISELYGYLSSPKVSNIVSELFEKFPDICPLPETTKPVTPVFTAGQCVKDNIVKLLGKIKVTDTKAEVRKIKPMETVSPSTSVESTSKQKKQDGHKKSDVKQTLSLSPSVTKIREFNVPGVLNTLHISLDKSGRLWASDFDYNDGNLVQTDLQGNQLQTIQTTQFQRMGSSSLQMMTIKSS